MTLEALVFDVDGTLADTEEVHRQAFNEAFRLHGLDWEWPAGLYRELLEVAGGRERLLHYVESLGLPEGETAWLRSLLPALHETKTRVFGERICEGHARPRPGIVRLLEEARAAGLRLAIATTTSPANVDALLPHVLGGDAPSWFSTVASGDAVARKKPAPDVYELVLERLGLAADRCVAFEDSALGVRAAKGAGLFTVATPTPWTAAHDLSEADLVLPTLGGPEQPLDPATARAIGAPWLDLPTLARLRAPATGGVAAER